MCPGLGEEGQDPSLREARPTPARPRQPLDVPSAPVVFSIWSSLRAWGFRSLQRLVLAQLTLLCQHPGV